MKVLVVGAGPAGLAVAAAMAERGIEVVVVAPDVGAPWPNRYGAFVDELDAIGSSPPISATWARAVVRTDHADFELGRAYARLDAEGLRGALMAGLSTATIREDRLDDLEGAIDRHGADLALDARGVVFDPKGAAQVAYGIDAKIEGDWPTDVATLMDFRTHAWPGSNVDPTFLYALPLGERRVFFEETSLVARPPLEISSVEARLNRRLEHLGVHVTEVAETERCFIPMERTPKPPTGRVVPFGAAAGLVHPATGYSIVQSLRLAPVVAVAVEDGRGAEHVWRAMWTVDRRRAHELYTFGREVLIELDATQLQAFFEAFFGVGDDRWFGYLTRTADAQTLSATMLRVFGLLPWSLRLMLARRSLSGDGARLLRGLGLVRPHA